MKRGVNVSIVAVIILAVALLSVYYFNLGLTGFAVLDQYSNESDCVDAGYTWENETNETCTEVTSEVCDEDCTTECVNITVDCEPCLEYEDINGTQGDCISWFSCEEENCTEICIDINCTNQTTEECETIVIGGQCEGDVCDSEHLNLCIDETTCSDANLLWYDDSCHADECESDSHCDSDYECRGGVCKLKKIVVNEEPIQTEESTLTAEEAPKIIKISLESISSQEIIQGNFKDLNLSFQNTGTEAVYSCALIGDDSGWINIIGNPINVEAGATGSLGFSVAIPEGTPVGAYTLSLSVTCTETSESTNFAVNVLQKKIDFNITDVQRTRQDRVSVYYIITELVGEDQDLEIFFFITDTSGTEIANASQNRSIKANKTDDFRTNIIIDESLLPVNATTGEPIETDLTLLASFNSQIYSSSVIEPITLGAVTGAAIFGGVGAGGLVIVVIVVLVLITVFFVAQRLRKSKMINSK